MTDWKNIAPITHAETERSGRRFVWQLAAFLVCIPITMIALRTWVAPWIEKKTGPVQGSPFAGLAKPAADAADTTTAATAPRTINLYVHGMECAMCAAHVEEEIGKVPGVQSVKADYETGKTEVVCRASDAVAAAIAQSLVNTKYTISDQPPPPPEGEEGEPAPEAPAKP
ncbi:MAG: heavy-metal-associated domain-containing protein [Phycisphaerales bacterium]